MKRKGAASFFMNLCIGSVVALLLFLVIILSNQRAFTREGELIETVTVILAVIALVSILLWAILLSSEKKSKYQDILNGQTSPHICPVCRINVTKDCQCCPNCKTPIKRR